MTRICLVEKGGNNVVNNQQPGILARKHGANQGILRTTLPHYDTHYPFYTNRSRIHPSPDESGDIKIMIGLVNLVKHNQFHRISSTSWRTFSRYATPSSK